MLKKVCTGALLMTVLCVAPHITTQAAEYPDVVGVQQTDMTESTITIEWDAINCDAYEISIRPYGEYDYKIYKVVDGITNECVIENLDSGAVYDIKVLGCDGYELGYDDYTVVYGAKTLVSAPDVKQDTWYHYINVAGISWTKQSAADSYDIVWYNAKGKEIKSENVSYQNASLHDVKNSNIYKAKVRANQILGDGSKYSSAWTTIKVFEQPFIKAGTKLGSDKKGKYLNINWTKQTGATGYDVYVGTNKNKFTKVKSLGKNATSLKLRNLKSKKLSKNTYYVYVVSKTKLNNKTNKSGQVYCWLVNKYGMSETYIS